jgi:hypothetical protein
MTATAEILLPGAARTAPRRTPLVAVCKTANFLYALDKKIRYCLLQIENSKLWENEILKQILLKYLNLV